MKKPMNSDEAWARACARAIMECDRLINQEPLLAGRIEAEIEALRERIIVGARSDEEHITEVLLEVLRAARSEPKNA